jgi:hypothetical protein
MKTRLSYSTLQSTILAPHTYINRLSGLKTFSTTFFEEGKEIHRIISDSVSGKTPHPLLKDIPNFPIVEKVDFDPAIKFEFDVNDKYYMIGFVDGLTNEKDQILEIKSGKSWSAGDFNRLMQWRIYAMGIPTAKKVWLVNTPRDEKIWMPETIKIYNADITPKHKEEAMNFINKGIAIIENIREEVEKEMQKKKDSNWQGRSRYCFYENCSWCQK